ncbi:MAG: cytochrome c [Xanthomonadales bacterium]|nr:cytochrome c [Xanthomonadales bacterium]
MLNRSRAIFAVSLIILGLCGCAEPPAELSDGTLVPGGAGAIALDQGWSTQALEQSWYASFGSRLLPYDWLKALEQPDSEALFLHPDHLRELGLMAQLPTEHNPSGYPVGFGRDQDADGRAWVGLGCATCHTGELRHGEQVIRLAGGQSLLNYSGFTHQLEQALERTASDDAKFSRFAEALASMPTDRPALREEIRVQAQRLSHLRELNHSPVAYGHGRLDAFGQIFNAVAVDGLGIAENRHVPDAPVSFPVLWSAPHLDLVQWNGSAPNAGPGPLLQNVTTAIAVFGSVHITDASIGGYGSSVDFAKLGQIQEAYYQLRAPRWPEALLGPIVAAKRDRGRALYASHCQSCHQIADDGDRKRKLTAQLTRVDEVGTDPKMVQNFLHARVRTGILEGKKQAVLAGEPFGAEARAIDVVVHAAIGVTLRHPVAAIRDSLVSYHSVIKAAIDNNPDYYKARPLDGIWASAPYLHNGSVPNLAELLSPPDQRSARFHLGSHAFDPVRVGVQTNAQPGSTLFDTSLPGNSNAGHTYGTELANADRADLLEFLKAL